MFKTEHILEELSKFNQRLTIANESFSKIATIELGFCVKHVLYKEDKVTLYRYAPRINCKQVVPLMIVFALVNRPDILDLDEEHSVVKMLLESGIEVYLIDWGYPDEQDNSITLEKYVTGYLKNCVEFVREYSSQVQINLLGICQGGVFSLCYTSLFPQHIKNLITVTTPVDFHTKDNMLCQLTKNVNIDSLVDKLGNIPGYWLNQVFSSLRPYRFLKKYLDIVDITQNDSEFKKFLYIEKWISDTPDQAGETFREFTKGFYQQNNLIKGGIVISKRKIRLQRITMPVLNLVAKYDYLVPPSTSLPLKRYVGTKDYSIFTFPTGHIGIYVSNKVKGQLTMTIVYWLLQRVGG